MPVNSANRKVSYFYDKNIGNFYYGAGHPMKPNRVRLVHKLVKMSGLGSKMTIFRPPQLPIEEMTRFHDEGYINFLESVTVDNKKERDKDIYIYLGKTENSDCPVFDSLFEFCQLYAGGSVAGAVKLNNRETDVAINWSGGLHHAKKQEATGFCYVNDIVLAALELLRFKRRVIYIDIDVHHGDGVEEAFYCTNRVLTASFHKGGNFFPNTGHIEDTGANEGKLYSVNVPLEEGISDDTFFSVFQPVTDALIERYRPEAVILQCGADSLAGDRLGCFNLTTRGHGRCAEHVLNYGLPTLMLGGGGYTVSNVARCWAHETALCLGETLPELLPTHKYSTYYAPDFQLHTSPDFRRDNNSPYFLDKTLSKVLSNIAKMPGAPSVEIGSRSPSNGIKFTTRKNNNKISLLEKQLEEEKDILDINENFSDLELETALKMVEPPEKRGEFYSKSEERNAS